jgi:cyanophycin synthetase
VAQAARGTVVLNGDDDRCVAMAEISSAARVCYVTMDPDHVLVADHIAAGGIAVTLRPDDGGPMIELHHDHAAVDILPAFDVPTALDGRAMHNVQNAMFAAAIAHGLGKSLEHIRSGLKSLGIGHDDTPGRLDIFDRLTFTVVLDYAHNAREFKMIATTVMQMECAGRRIVAISSPGNRTDEQIHHLGVGAAYDHYICCRRDDLRGRGPSEVPERLRDGLLAGGIAAENVSVVPPEEDAVKAALDMARPGDLVVLLYTDHNRTWDLLTAACDK